MTAAERMRRFRRRRKAAGLKAMVRWITEESEPSTYSPHRLLEARSLAMHAVIASKIERDLAVLATPRDNIERWSARWKGDAPAWFHEGSPFHDLCGYYAQGIDERTATLPRGWRERLVKINTPNTRGARVYVLRCTFGNRDALPAVIYREVLAGISDEGVEAFHARG